MLWGIYTHHFLAIDLFMERRSSLPILRSVIQCCIGARSEICVFVNNLRDLGSPEEDQHFISSLSLDDPGNDELHPD